MQEIARQADSFVLSHGASRTGFLIILLLTALFGLSLLPFREVDLFYMGRLVIHIVLGLLTFICTMIFFFYKTGRTIGWVPALLHVLIYMALFLGFSAPIFFTESVIIIFLSILGIDWHFTKRRLARSGYRSKKIRQARSVFIDFALLFLACSFGLYQMVPTPFYIDLHKFHSIFLIIIVVRISLRHIRDFSPLPRFATIGGVSILICLFSYFYMYKQILRNDETDPKHSGVLQTVESKSERHKLKDVTSHLLQGSDSCAECHGILANQWRGSSHRFSVNNQFFQKLVALFIQMEGSEHVRICINCHDPATALLPDAEERYVRGQIDNPEGISCKACHVITAFDPDRGNGLYTMKTPSTYPFEGSPSGSRERMLNKFFIILDSRRHLRNYRRKHFYRSGEYCLSCHLVTIPESITQDKPLQLHTLFDQWRGSEWEKDLNCVDCHMPIFQMDGSGYGIYDHRIMGINTDLLVSADVPDKDVEFVEDFSYFTRRYIAGDLAKGTYEVLVKPEQYNFWKNPRKAINPITLIRPSLIKRVLYAQRFLSSGPILSLKVILPEYLSADNKLLVNLQTTNERVGHNFPSGPIDVQEVWLETILFDEESNIVFHQGWTDERHYVDPAAPILGSRGIVDKEGRKLLRHEFWKAARVIDKRVLGPHDSVQDRLDLPMAKRLEGDYRLILRWKFRRMNQRIVDWVWSDAPRTMPVLVLDEAELKLKVGRDLLDENRYCVKVQETGP